STLLAEQMVRVARETGLDTLQLEVLTQNIRAIKLYTRVGFTTTRRLLGLEIATSALPAGSATLRSEPVAVEALLSYFAEGGLPCWGRELASILAAPVESIIAIGPDGRINGLVMQRGDDKIRIQALLLQSKLTDAELASLLRQAAGSASGIRVHNEPEDSLLLTRYQALGFTESFSQYEMFVKLQ
ncbi:MAG TPA: GNAT family N-acetyltransferase, partial [Ktedonobacteraceae bacterium]